MDLLTIKSLDSTPAPPKKKGKEWKRETISFYKVGIPHWKNKAIKYQPTLPPGPRGKKENTCTIPWEIRWTKPQSKNFKKKKSKKDPCLQLMTH